MNDLTRAQLRAVVPLYNQSVLDKYTNAYKVHSTLLLVASTLLAVSVSIGLGKEGVSCFVKCSTILSTCLALACILSLLIVLWSYALVYRRLSSDYKDLLGRITCGQISDDAGTVVDIREPRLYRKAEIVAYVSFLAYIVCLVVVAIVK